MAQFGPLAAVLTTGDDAYERGTPAEAAFGRAVLTPLLHGATRLVGVVGNHDVATDGGRPVERALGMPARWYRTIVGPVEVVVLDANDPGNAAQLRFLSATMGRRRTTPWRIVAFHQPAYACSLHTADEAVQRLWLPLFRGRVDLVLSGHNHSYERFTGTGGTPFVTTGGGGAPLYPSLSALCTGGGHVELLRAVHHALRLAVTTHRLRLEAVDVRGQVFDTLVLTR